MSRVAWIWNLNAIGIVLDPTAQSRPLILSGCNAIPANSDTQYITMFSHRHRGWQKYSYRNQQYFINPSTVALDWFTVLYLQSPNHPSRRQHAKPGLKEDNRFKAVPISTPTGTPKELCNFVAFIVPILIVPERWLRSLKTRTKLMVPVWTANYFLHV